MKGLLFASLLFALAPYAPAQQKALESRQDDLFKGPVRSVRVERTAFERVGGRLVEGARRVTAAHTYTPDGKRLEREEYAPDGKLKHRYVRVHDDAGNRVEETTFDGSGSLQRTSKRVSKPGADETLTYNARGTLISRRVTVKRPDGTEAEELYYARGALQERLVNDVSGKTSVWRTYRADGTLSSQRAETLGDDGSRKTESKVFAPDGSVVDHAVTDEDAARTEIRATFKSPGYPTVKRRTTYEYDSRKNPTKQTELILNDETGEYEPLSVTYFTIEYYR